MHTMLGICMYKEGSPIDLPFSAIRIYGSAELVYAIQRYKRLRMLQGSCHTIQLRIEGAEMMISHLLRPHLQRLQ